MRAGLFRSRRVTRNPALAGWRAARLRVGALLVAALGAAGCGDAPEPIGREALENATFLTLEGGEITLAEGVTTSEDGARHELLVTAEGDLDFDSDVDAVAVLAADQGRERSVTLHAVLRDGGGLRDVSARLIGDRIEVHRAEILDGMIRVSIRVRGPGDPITAPLSVDRTPYFALTSRGLTPIALIDVADGEDAQAGGAEAGSGTPAATPALDTHEWELESFDAGDGSGNLRLPRERVTLRFRAELRGATDLTGRLAGFAGCNRIFGNFRVREVETIGFSGVAAMRKQCRGRQADFEERFLEALRAVNAFQLEGDRMTLAHTGGAIRFRAGRRLDSHTPGMM